MFGQVTVHVVDGETDQLYDKPLFLLYQFTPLVYNQIIVSRVINHSQHRTLHGCDSSIVSALVQINISKRIIPIKCNQRHHSRDSRCSSISSSSKGTTWRISSRHECTIKVRIRKILRIIEVRASIWSSRGIRSTITSTVWACRVSTISQRRRVKLIGNSNEFWILMQMWGRRMSSECEEEAAVMSSAVVQMMWNFLSETLGERWKIVMKSRSRSRRIVDCSVSSWIMKRHVCATMRSISTILTASRSVTARQWKVISALAAIWWDVRKLSEIFATLNLSHIFFSFSSHRW